MKKVLDILKKYLVFSFVLSIIIFIWVIGSMIESNALQTINIFYFVKIVLCILGMTVILIPMIALCDLCFIVGAKGLYEEYKHSNSRGKIILIIVCIVMLLKKITEWTR